MAHTTVPDIMKAIKSADFPASKEDLVEAARRSGASEEVVKALRGIPPEQYTNRDDVAHSVRVDVDSDQDTNRSRRAEQARQGGKPGLAQGLRDVPKPPIQEELDQ
ncbi:DUF2795 domain-containing protein [Streptomyces coeruleoprunus]|uniref:DUF2795 domain-containing protein n=1 Tax=Streptomyces coeruleoprunus TaxID=285563 RepID=A0ABV9X7V4_9ACTN